MEIYGGYTNVYEHMCTEGKKGKTLEFFLNNAELPINSVNSAYSGDSDKSLKHELAQLKVPISHVCLAGTVIPS